MILDMKDKIIPKMRCNDEAHKLQLLWIEKVKEII